MDHPGVDIPECKCGMPLCICKASAPSVNTAQIQRQTDSTSIAQSNQRRKNTDPISRNAGSTSNSRHSSFLHCDRVTNSDLGKTQMDYDVSGEGLREAIKNCDTAAVKKLLSEGVDANYCDKQGLSLLHLASLFNYTDIAFALMEYGASLESKNAQGETPLDCAAPMLQYKIRKKIEGSQ